MKRRDHINKFQIPAWRINRSIPFIVLFLVVLLIHLFLDKSNDDFWFANTIYRFHTSDNGLIGILQAFLDYTKYRYDAWTSRNIIEVVQVILSVLPIWIWRIVDSVLFTSIAVSITKIFFTHHPQRYSCSIFVVLSLLTYYFMSMNSAGCIATTANYVFPVAFGLIAIYGVKKVVVDKQKISACGYIGYTLALLYASNSEQMCVVLLLVLIGFAGYTILHRDIKNKYVYVQLALVVLMLAYILTCPGNAARSVDEGTIAFFPEYVSLSLFEKILLGFSCTVNQLMINENLLFFIFVVFIACMVFMKSKTLLPRITALVPPIYLIYIGAMHSAAHRGSKAAINFFGNLTKYGLFGENNVNTVVPYVWTAVMLLVFVCIISSCFIIFQERYKAWIITGILAIGFISQFMIGFSPTVWASGDRTALVLNVALVASIAWLFKDFDFENKSATNALRALFAGSALFETVYIIAVAVG